MATVLEMNDGARYSAHLKTCDKCWRAKFQWDMCPTGLALQAMFQADQKPADAYAALITQFNGR
jgi:hypothetical protein